MEKRSSCNIFLYEYNATVVYDRNRNTFINITNELLEIIRIEKYYDMSRPIIFLSYNLKKLLIKQALINAHNNPKYTFIKMTTSELTFFATLYNDKNLLRVSLSCVSTNIPTTLNFQKEDDLLKMLQNDNMFSKIMHKQ